MGEPDAPGSHVPAWVSSLRAPVWVTAPSRTICWMNTEAARLLGVSPGGVLGRPCHEVVRGRDASGRPFCSPACRSSVRVREGRRLAAFRLGLPGPAGPGRWVRLLIIPVTRPESGETSLVHCVVNSEREERMERYLQSVAGRWRSLPGQAAAVAQELTRREEEILDLLARDESMGEIAVDLGVSYTTVRNHVQHILRKTGTHSIVEAVARRLLSDEGEAGP